MRYLDRLLISAALLLMTAEPLLSAKFGQFTYIDNGTNITITDCDEALATGSGFVPSSINGKPVTTIGNRAFDFCQYTSMTLPASVTSIGDYAFHGCDRMTSINIPNGLTNLGVWAFGNCKKLQNITLPGSVTQVKQGTFDGCESLATATLAEGIETIGDFAFRNCTALTTMSFASTVSSFNYSNTFEGCTSLNNFVVAPESSYFSFTDGVLFNRNQSTLTFCLRNKTGPYVIPSTVVNISNYAFKNCTALVTVVIPPSVRFIGFAAFDNCRGLTGITIPPSVLVIDTAAFQFCSALKSLTLSQGVQTIRSSAFRYTALEDVQIPSSVTSIGAGAFAPIASLKKITVDEANAYYQSDQGVLFNKTGTLLSLYPGQKAGDYSIPSSVTKIESHAFQNCSLLTRVVIPTGVATIGPHAFDGCTSLISVTLPEGLTTIDRGVFRGCASLTGIIIPATVANISNDAFSSSGLTDLNIPEGVTDIAPYAFARCESLKHVRLPSTVATIGEHAFSGCRSLQTFIVDSRNANYSDENGALLSKSGIKLLVAPMGRDSVYVIPSGVQVIASNAFSVPFRTIGVVIPESVSTLESTAFYSSTPLEFYFLGNAPSNTGSHALPRSGTVFYFSGTSGFTSPTWLGVKSISMGPNDHVKRWLLTNQIPFDTEISSDLNGDGVPLLMAYALGFNPSQNLSNQLPIPEVLDNQLNLRFYAGSPGITYKIEASSDLKNWSATGANVSAPDALQFRTATIATSGSRCFLRLLVTKP